MAHATFTKRYVHSQHGMDVFASAYVNGYITDCQGVFLEDGSWLGVVVPQTWAGADGLAKLPGVTLLPSMHNPSTLKTHHVAVLKHAGVNETHTMWQAAEMLHAHHSKTHGTAAAMALNPDHH